MNEKRRAKVESAARRQGLLEENERVEAEVQGVVARNFWQTMLLLGAIGQALLQRGRDFILTDRNVYFCQTGSMSGMPKRVIAKSPLGEGKLKLTKTGLALDGDHALFVGRLLRGRTREFYERAQALSAAQRQAEPGEPAPAAT